jgi:hypothetical protein
MPAILVHELYIYRLCACGWARDPLVIKEAIQYSDDIVEPFSRWSAIVTPETTSMLFLLNILPHQVILGISSSAALFCKEKKEKKMAGKIISPMGDLCESDKNGGGFGADSLGQRCPTRGSPLARFCYE